MPQDKYSTVANNIDNEEKKGEEEKEKEEKEVRLEDLPVEQQLFHFAKTGDADGIKKIHKNVNINAQDKELKEGKYVTMATALHYACQYGHLNVVKMLHSLEANIEAQNKLRSTPLHVAASNGHADICKFLVDSKADLRADNKIGNIPLHCAIYSGHLQIAKILLDSEADPKAALKTNNGIQMTPVRYCPRDNLELRKYLAQWFKGEKNVKDLAIEEDEVATAVANPSTFQIEEEAANPPTYQAPISNNRKNSNNNHHDEYKNNDFNTNNPDDELHPLKM